MIGRISDALHLPLSTRNQMLTHAGFAARYQETNWDAEEMAIIRHALDHTLTNHNPYPAFAIDRLWNIIQLNRTAERLFGILGVSAGGSLLELAVSAGAGLLTGGGNVLGFAGHWGKPNEDTYGTDLEDQYAGEIYFRWKIGKHFEVTPNLQLLIDPALNPEENTIWVFGLRAKGSL